VPVRVSITTITIVNPKYADIPTPREVTVPSWCAVPGGAPASASPISASARFLHHVAPEGGRRPVLEPGRLWLTAAWGHDLPGFDGSTPGGP
jgi:hypothetical protein